MTSPTLPAQDDAGRLDRCPFCGAHAALYRDNSIFAGQTHEKYANQNYGYRIECEGSCHAMTCYWHTREEAFTAWNLRAAALHQGEPVAQEPFCYVIPGDGGANSEGWLDARVTEHGEFTKPLYAHFCPAKREACVAAGPRSLNGNGTEALGCSTPDARSCLAALTAELHYANGTCELALKHRDEAEAKVERLRDACNWIDAQRYVNRATVHGGNAFDSYIRLNDMVIALMDRARAALAETGGAS